ncbi:MAG: ABC transporter permease [Thermoanaerobaculia bacterium]|nr:ABC transporter permease [Thermoanaerobaculia bacterium]
MSTTIPATEKVDSGSIDWELVRRQFGGILRMELRGTLLSKRMLAVLFLAFAPVALVAVWVFTPMPQAMDGGPMDSVRIFSVFFVLYLGVSVFLSCLILFMSMFRNEIQERTLHYYYLSPVPREVVVVAKYLAGQAAALGTFIVGTAIFYLLIVSPWGLDELSRHMIRGPGFGNLTTYVGLSVLGCLGYGAIFLLAGLLIRNPVVVAIVVWAWEGLVPLLPVALKKLTITHYLQSMYPVPVAAKQFFAVFAEPTPGYLAVPGLLLVSTLLLALSCWRARAMEIKYGGED